MSSIQPGGGMVMRLELMWGRVRRWYLGTFRRAYLQRMRASRQGSSLGRCPFEPLDPRDLKYYRNQTTLHWRREDDRFAWRDRIPFARVGLAELFLIAGSLVLVAALLARLWWPLAVVPGAASALVVWFFRDPERQVPPDTGVLVSPADGRIVAVERVDDDDFIGGPAVRIDIFLSIFNVHMNRSPADATVVGLVYRPGKFLNALRPEASRENEQLELRLEECRAPHRPLLVRQITGAIARRIVCWMAPGELLQRGERFGMIKLGSRTELVLPAGDDVEILVTIGDKVRAGSTAVARWATGDDGEAPAAERPGHAASDALTG